MGYRASPRDERRTMSVSFRSYPLGLTVAFIPLFLACGVAGAMALGRTGALECARFVDGAGTCIVRSGAMFDARSEQVPLSSLGGVRVERLRDDDGDQYELRLQLGAEERILHSSSNRALAEVDAAAIETYLRDPRPLRYRAAWGDRMHGVWALVVACGLAGVVAYLMARVATARLERTGGRLHVYRTRFARTAMVLDAALSEVRAVVEQDDDGELHRLVITTSRGDCVPLEDGYGHGRERREAIATQVREFVAPASDVG